ncbi:MAG: serpin family protein [Eubacteriales bacterium]
MKVKNRFMRTVIYIILSALITVSLAACSENITGPDNNDKDTSAPETTSAESENNEDTPKVISLSVTNLMEKVTSSITEGKTVNSDFVFNSADFALELFKKSASTDENSMISPLSVLLALSMTANGADGNTLAEMEKVLGSSFTIDELNEYLRGYIDSLTSTDKAKLSIANSIWFRDDDNSIQVNKDFLQTNADYYNADAYSAAFDEQTLADINNWVNINTDGLIKSILDKIPGEAVMYLINAMVFDATWQEVYTIEQISEGAFNANDGTAQTVSMMRSEESKYLDDGKATGFIKPYADGQYSFAALLPNEDVSIQDYIASMTGEGFTRTIADAKSGIVYSTLPKFTSEYKIEMNGALGSLGMADAFAPELADFSKLGNSSLGNIFISSVLHKTYISVDELGTKAGAVTSVEMSVTSMPVADIYTVTLDRPFVYAIIDTNTNLPLFIGAVLNIN